MIKCTANNSEAQAQRLQIKTIHRQMENLAVSGAGLSPWEARELVGVMSLSTNKFITQGKSS